MESLRTSSVLLNESLPVHPTRRDVMRFLLTLMIVLLFFGVSGQSAPANPSAIYRDPQAPLAARVEDLLARLTLEEKLGQLSQGCIATLEEVEPSLEPVRSGRQGAMILNLPPEQSVAVRNRVQREAVEHSAHGIPLIFGFDTIHGYRTTMPIPLGLSASWDPAVIERAQAVAARESRAGGVDVVFAPMCDLALDPRWGRVAETFGEDPFLNGALVAASVRGFQGDDPSAPGRVGATLKHYVGYGASAGGRDYNETSIPLFTLRNFHLPPFRAGVQAGAFSVMSSFNANDGVPVVTDHFALTEVLRNEWGFKGFVVSDWDSVTEAIIWGHAADSADAARRALTAGNDMEMVGTNYRDTLGAQVRAGLVPPEIVDEAVRRIIRTKFQLGLFEHPYADPTAPARDILQASSVSVARESATRSIVLLKNDGVLPLKSAVRNIALIGPLADEAGELLGTWAGWGKKATVVPLAAGLRCVLPEGVALNVVPGVPLIEDRITTRTLLDGTIVREETGDTSDSTAGIAGAVAAARNADVVIAALGEPRGWSGENASRTELTITGRQQELLNAVAATGKPVIVVIFSGRPLALPLVAARANALLQAWHPGIMGGVALADIIFGVVAPTGHLTVSFPRSVGQVPVNYNHLNTGRPDRGDYRDLSREPLYPFGFGLTYTTFSYSAARVTAATVAVTITNTGARAGEALPQFYVRDVACSEGARPVQELRGWQRVTLRPGESREVVFALDDAALGFYARDGQWRVEPGVFHVWIAPHAGSGEPAVFELSKAPAKQDI